MQHCSCNGEVSKNTTSTHFIHYEMVDDKDNKYSNQQTGTKDDPFLVDSEDYERFDLDECDNSSTGASHRSISPPHLERGQAFQISPSELHTLCGKTRYAQRRRDDMLKAILSARERKELPGLNGPLETNLHTLRDEMEQQKRLLRTAVNSILETNQAWLEISEVHIAAIREGDLILNKLSSVSAETEDFMNFPWNSHAFSSDTLEALMNILTSFKDMQFLHSEVSRLLLLQDGQVQEKLRLLSNFPTCGINTTDISSLDNRTVSYGGTHTRDRNASLSTTSTVGSDGDRSFSYLTDTEYDSMSKVLSPTRTGTGSLSPVINQVINGMNGECLPNLNDELPGDER